MARVHGLRYQAAILLRSHRWIFPPIAYGLLIALVCLAVGSLCNPPLLRHPAAAMLSTLAAIIVALVADISPAAAAIRHTGAGATSPVSANWPGPGSVAGAACLLAAAWGVSVLAARQRDTWSANSE